MPAVFVHGVPDTARVWHSTLKHLKRKDTICLALPGFGNKRPAGFNPDKDSYADWINCELKKIEALVGHDWGSLLVTRVVSIAPDLIRTWSAGAAPLDPDYVWHDTAQVWQTPGKGEELMKMFTGEPLAVGLSTQGIPLEDARETASLIDDEMKASVLTLYRSATKVAGDWFADLKNAKAPGLILWGENDPFAAPKFGERLAANTRSRFKLMIGAKHWYQIEQPEKTAHELEAFWAEHL